MIREIKTLPKYGRYFLSMEADDELSDDPNIKANTKIITINPSSRSNRFIKIGDEAQLPEEDEIVNDEVDTPQDTEIPQEDENLNPVVTDDGEVQEPENSDNDPIISNNIEDTINADNEELGLNQQAEFGGEPDTSADTEINTDEPEPVISDTDFGADGNADDIAETDPMADAGAPPIDDPNTPAVKRGPGIEYNSTRKYVLFKKYLELCSSIKDYIDDISELMNDNYNSNQVYKVAVAKLSEIYDVTYDFITMRFELSSYIQALLFYQERVVTVYKIFDMIDYGLKSIDKNDK